MKLWCRRIFWFVSMSIFLFMTTGCGGPKVVRSVEQEVHRKDTDIQDDKGQKIKGYMLMDGIFHKYDGRVALAGSDSLSFWKKTKRRRVIEDGKSVLTSKRVDEYKLSVNDVATLRVCEARSTGQKIGITFLVIFGLATVAFGIALATKESCPFIYSFDGEQYVFDGEPYGGATMSSLQRTDCSELEHLKPVDGEYRLQLTNEVDETQHTDHLELVTVDHPSDTRVVMDLAGKVHCFAAQDKLAAARDENGRDLMVWLHADDESAWYPDLEFYAGQDSLMDTRNHITLEFARPACQDSLYLVSNVGTGQWGSHMIRVMFGMRGNRVQEFYDAINGSVDFQNQLRAWNEREELFIMGVEVQEGDRWVRRGELHGGGPFISERRAVPLDVSGVQGETIRLRIHPPIGFWSLNSFHLAWDERPATITHPEFVSATDQDGHDVRQLLQAVDATTLDFPTNREMAELVFAAPPPADEGIRTIFAKTTGWYEIHLYPEGPPEADNLLRLTFEPGYIVHRAMQEFSEYRSTGVLGFTRPDQPSP